MNILFVAPQPFYQQRGTPIAVRMAVTALCKAGHKVDLLTYHEGEDVQVEGLRIVRIPKPPFVSNVPLGFSWKKVVCDLLLSIELPYLLSRGRYDAIHAVEEAIFPAALVNLFTRKSLIYDMDSDLTEDLIGSVPALRLLQRPLRTIHRLAIQRANVVLAVCPALAQYAAESAPAERVLVLNDVPFEPADGAVGEVEDLRSTLGLTGLMALYVGNLERHQGIELMLESFALLDAALPVELVIIGGEKRQVEAYAALAARLGIGQRCHLVGPRPLKALPGYLQQADILLSPRLRGVNTPMKIYSYMWSGAPILATDILSHSQVLNADSAVLVKPRPHEMADGLYRLMRDPGMRKRIGETAAEVARRRYSRAEFDRKLAQAYAALNTTRPI